MHNFVDWLLQQQSRQDPVGELARVIRADRTFPRGSRRLYVFLAHFDSQLPHRQALKVAHAEWRSLKQLERHNAR